jgi:hypothetical protein
MPDRGLLAPLSPNEEVTLRRVALGVAKPARLSERDLERLKALSLIEEHGGGLRLTPTGRERYLALPKSAAVHQSETTPDYFISKLADFMTKARGSLRAGYP